MAHPMLTKNGVTPRSILLTSALKHGKENRILTTSCRKTDTINGVTGSDIPASQTRIVPHLPPFAEKRPTVVTMGVPTRIANLSEPSTRHRIVSPFRTLAKTNLSEHRGTTRQAPHIAAFVILGIASLVDRHSIRRTTRITRSNS